MSIYKHKVLVEITVITEEKFTKEQLESSLKVQLDNLELEISLHSFHESLKIVDIKTEKNELNFNEYMETKYV